MPVLRSIDEVLTPVLAQVRPVAPALVLTRDAVGLVLAEALRAPASLPPRALALRDGLAVSSLELVGASAHSPVMLVGPPRAVRRGEPMPVGCDAIVDPASALARGAFTEHCESAAPGAWVRQEGDDLSAGTCIARAGEPLSAEAMLAALAAGIDRVAVRQPTARLLLGDKALEAWLAARLARLGFRLGEGDADLAIAAASGPPRLALSPGEEGWIELAGRAVRIEAAARFDALLAVHLALVLPAAAALTGRVLREEALPLTRKISSAVGSSDLVLLKRAGAGWEPIAVGEVTLAGLMTADAFALLQPGSEGLPPGALLAATALDHPLSAPA